MQNQIFAFISCRCLSTMSASEFYYACRNGELAKVQSLLESMSKDEIDRMEPNGSTALHAAAYYGHGDIVRVLLEKGAARKQNNKYGKTPEEEAITEEITQIFHDINDRFNLEWAITDVFNATSYHRQFYSFNHGPPSLSYVVQQLLSAQELRSAGKKDTKLIRKMFERALRNNDIAILIEIYTMETPFYKVLHDTLAGHSKLTDEERENPPWFCAYARLLASDEPKLRPYQWTGVTYRGMITDRRNLMQIQVGKIFMNKVFMSTSKNKDVAMSYTKMAKIRNSDTQFLIYKLIINDPRAALDIREVSQYQCEEEVLILPCMDFEVTQIQQHDKLTEVTLLLR